MVCFSSWACQAKMGQYSPHPHHLCPHCSSTDTSSHWLRKHFLGTAEVSAPHLGQLQPDGLGVISGAIVEFQARDPIVLQWAEQVEPLQVFQGDGAAGFLG